MRKINTKRNNSFMPKKQKQGIFLLYGIGIGVIITILLILFINISNSETTKFDKDDIVNSGKKENSEKKYREKFKKDNYNSKTKFKPFFFNPNDISKTKLIEFGLSERQANNFVNYVKAGGRFNSEQDLRKLYCMNDFLYNKMSPYVRIPKKEETISQSPTNKTEITISKSHIIPSKPLIILDINEADSLDFQILRGIGPSYAKRIYIYGKKLGGYVKIEQIKEVYGMTDTLYISIVQYLKIENVNPTKLNINTSTIKELSSHPYIDFYLAKAIIKLRIELNNYKSIDQLRQIHLLDQKTYEKLLPYLEL